MPYLWQTLATARPMPEAAPVMRAVLPALNTGWRGMVGDWGVGGGVGLGVFGGEKSAGGFKWRRGIPSLATICIENIVPTLFGVR